MPEVTTATTCVLCGFSTGHHEYCLDWEPYNEFCHDELTARLVHLLIKLAQGYKIGKIPPFPGDKRVSQVKSGTGLFGAVKAAFSVSDIAGRFTELTEIGPDHLRGCCPLHQEKTGSFHVWEDKGTWRCFGACARGGDVIQLTQLLLDKGLLK